MKTQPYILVIDDENYICESCNRIFSNAGYKVDTNINASNGFRQALMNPYDAIILDLNLVESDGMKLLYGIRKRKPDVPVVIITGYPSEDTRRMSTTLGVIDYITKPFEPADILDPVQKVLAGQSEMIPIEETGLDELAGEPKYQFFLSSWFFQQENGMLRVGGYLTNSMNHMVRSIQLPKVGSHIHRGLPLAEVTLNNDAKHIIPSPVSGKVILVNNLLRDHFYNLEKNIHKKSWIAVVGPNNLENDLKTSETRNILILSDKSSDENEFFKKFIHNGYNTKITNNIDNVMRILSAGVFRAVVLDARNLGDTGPDYVRRINLEFPDVRIIVLNEPDLNFERMYRKHNIFYYGVNPISNNEIIEILHCAFTDDMRKTSLKNPRISRFLPNTISKISITNRYGAKVTILAYNEILQQNHGLGFLLSEELLSMAFPLEIDHARSAKLIEEATEIQHIADEKEKNDRVIVLQTKDLGLIPGSITKDIQEYTNQNASLNLLINISVQPLPDAKKAVEFDANTILALKDIILSEMIST